MSSTKKMNQSPPDNGGKIRKQSTTVSPPIIWASNNAVGIAHNVYLPDGSNVPIMVCGNPETGQYRYLSSNDCWIYGDIVETNQELIFQPTAVQPPAGEYPKTPLVAALTAETNFTSFISYKGVAVELVSSLTNVMWTNGRSLCCMNHVEAGNFVADIRGYSECYSDFILKGRSGLVTDTISELLVRIGWYPVNPTQTPENPALSDYILRICEAREYGPVDPWVFYYHRKFTLSPCALGRMIRCCYNGQVTLTEWELYYLNNLVV